MTTVDPLPGGGQAASARRRRSLAIALLLVLFIVLVYSVTLVRLSQNRSAPLETVPAGSALREPVGG